MASLLKAAGSVTGAPLTADAAAAASQKTIMSYFNGKVSWFGLFLLAGGFPFPPMSYLGLGGLNLWASGSMTYFAVKAGLQAVLTVANMFIEIYYPKLWWFGYLLVLNPWYVFDIVQMFSPAFAAEGFKVPFLHTPIGHGGTGQMTPAIWAAAIALLCSGAYSFLNFLPPQLKAAYKPILNTVFLAFGAVTALAGGSIGGMVVLPQIMSSIKGSISQATAAAAAPPPAQKGGGMPSLADVANNILDDKIKVQGGGGKDGAELFLGGLAVAALGGISLALIRSKAVSSGSV
jgi:hypothetical protein